MQSGYHLFSLYLWKPAHPSRCIFKLYSLPGVFSDSQIDVTCLSSEGPTLLFVPLMAHKFVWVISIIPSRDFYSYEISIYYYQLFFISFESNKMTWNWTLKTAETQLIWTKVDLSTTLGMWLPPFPHYLCIALYSRRWAWERVADFEGERMKDEGSRRKHHTPKARAISKISEHTICEISEARRPDTPT